MNYEEYLTKWLDGIQDEIAFWDNFMKTEGGEFFYGFQRSISPHRIFELEDDIPLNMYGKKYRFVDVGSGPFSRCGTSASKVKLEPVAIDPLAYVYEGLKSNYKINNGVKVINGFVELLAMQFDANTFDMVHMSNSLDHCFSPIDGLYQLLNICKIGGKVILRHHENEAQNENYKGFHQWNLSLNNPEKSFVIWRGDERIDICKLFSEFVDFELYPNQRETSGYWIYNKVVMIKKKNIGVPPTEHYYEILNAVYKKLCDLYLKSTESCGTATYCSDRLMDKIRSVYHNFDRSKMILKNNNIGTVAIYGFGKYGKNICFLLESMGVQISYIFDKKGRDAGREDVEALDKCNGHKRETDLVIVTVEGSEVYKELSQKGFKNCKSVDEFLVLFD